MHRRDVDAVFAKDGTDASDDTGAVVVVNIEQIAFWRHVDGEVVNFHNPRAVAVETRTRNGASFLRRLQGNRQQVGKAFVLRRLLLGNGDVAHFASSGAFT